MRRDDRISQGGRLQTAFHIKPRLRNRLRSTHAPSGRGRKRDRAGGNRTPTDPFVKDDPGTFTLLITTQAKRNLSSRSGIGGVLSAT